jgi:diguanylate cyclase (GGDEF)-like protein/PAS domain S-box-containing protein
MNRLLRDLSISIKAFTASTVLVLFMAALGTQASLFLSSVRTDLKSLSDSSLPKQQAVLEIAKDVIDTHVNVFRYVAWASTGVNPATLNRLREQIGRDSIHVEASLGALAIRADLSETERAAISNAAAKWQRYATAVGDTVEISTTDPALGTVMLGGTDEDYIKVAGDLQIISSLVTGHTVSATQGLLSQADQNQHIIAWGGVAAVIIGLAVTLIVARSFVAPIKTVTRAMQAVSAGDAHVDLGPIDRKDEIGQMLTAISNFRERLKHDITERRRVELERDRSQKFLTTIIENVPAPIFVKEANERRYVLVNRAGETFWGVSRAEMIGKTSHEVFPKEEADRIAVRDAQLLQSDQPIFEEHQVLTPRNGRRTIVSKRLVVSEDDGKSRYVVGVIEDVTERKRAEALIAHQANYDALTDLPNRVHFAEQLDQALTRVRRGERLAILYIDIDHFKGVNDSFGHAIGDALLKKFADRLRGCVREIDSVARLSGDEFVIIQRSIDGPSDAAALAMRIREAIKAPYDLNNHPTVVDSSIGIAIAPNDSTEPDELLKAADMALYEAKTRGRGTYCFYESEMDEGIKARSKLELDLRKALASGEFELFYQPIVNLQDNRITSCEALLRWHHPERGLISPAEFIPIAEEIGIITQLGEWVLRTACAEAATWPDDINVAVNFSPNQLTSNNAVQVVVSALAASAMPAHRLQLEITELVFMKKTFATLATLRQLHELGVRIAMDDFGTGYSSLSYLLNFPFNIIKIDRCFIKDLADEDNSRSIVRAIVSLTASLGMTTTAEGVETEQQLEQIRVLGCTEMQGYLFSPPRPAAEIFRMFDAEEAECAA